MTDKNHHKVITKVYKTETGLHAMLGGLSDGDHIKATWVYGERTVAVDGPVHKEGWIVRCDRHIRWAEGSIDIALTSLEVSHDEETTVARDDVVAIHNLLDSLENGEMITAEWRNEKGAMTLTGTIRTDGDYVEVGGYYVLVIRQGTGVISEDLHSVTVRHTIVQRWEREGDE